MAMEANGEQDAELEEFMAPFSELDLHPVWATGFFAALHSGPKTILPSEWLPHVLGEESPFTDMASARTGLEMLMGMSNTVGSKMRRAPESVCPAVDEEEGVAEFCSGYVAGAHLHPSWRADDFAMVPLFVFAALAGEVEEEILGPDEKPLADRAAWEQMHRERLGSYVAELYTYWRDAPKAKTKLGRNDPCPCGSGKKHKKCCMS